MIWFVYGEPRTGKSLFGGLVDGVLPALKKGRRLFTNIPLIRLGLCNECGISVLEYNRLVNPINTLQDIFQIYDQDTKNIKRDYLDCVFVIDEFRALTGLNQQSEIFFTRILNVVSKSACDFILIAQLPTYFDNDTRDLGEGCSYFERGDRMGKPNHSIEWQFDKKAGTPTRIGNKWDTEFFRYRERKSKYFNMYHSYSAESEELMLERGEDHRALPFWKKRSFKYGCIVAFIVVIIVIIALCLFSSTTKTLDTLTTKKEHKQVENSVKLQEPKKMIRLTNEDVKNSNVLCYENIWVNDGIVTYKLNNGNYAYNPSYLIPRCSRILYRDKALE